MENNRKIQRKSTKKQVNLSARLHELTKNLYQEQHKYEAGQHYDLEDQWSDIINPSLQVYMTNRTKLQQRAIWEFLVTEKNYIKKLRIIVEVFLQSFKLIQSGGELQDVEQREVFGNIDKVLLANDAFWVQHLMKVLEKTRRTREPIVPSELLQCLYQAEKTFAPYLEFCMQQDGCLKNIRYVEQTESRNDNLINFKTWLAWVQNLPQCGRSKLADLMTEPMQRLTRYPLLLNKIYSETTAEEEKRKLDAMIRSAKLFVYNINKAIRTEDEKIRVESCLKEFDYYSVMDAGCEEVKWIAIDFLRLNVQGLPVEEPRCILKHAPMKMIEKKGKTEQAIELFLFTDLIALARTRRSTNKLTIIRQLYFLDKVKLLKSQSSDTAIVFIYLDEAGLLATTFVLEVNGNERDVTNNERRKKDISYERDAWVTTILKAKKIYEKARSGHGSTFDFFQEDGTSRPEAESVAFAKPASSHPDSVENVYDELDIPLDVTAGKVRQNAPLLTNYMNRNKLPCERIPRDPTASWVFTNNEQTSDTSDMSSEPCRIGESFKSNKSDSDIIHNSSDSGVSTIRTCNSVPELANAEQFNHVTPRSEAFDACPDTCEDNDKKASYRCRTQNVKNVIIYEKVNLPLKTDANQALPEKADKQTQTDFG